MPVIELQNVWKGYGRGDLYNSVLEDVNLSVDEGEFVAIYGASGTGKTTLVSMLAGLKAPDRGQMLRGESAKKGGVECGVVLQNTTQLPFLSVEENLLFSIRGIFQTLNESQLSDHCEQYLMSVGMNEFADHRPTDLSLGKRRRLALASALATEPKLLLLDEPLAGIDSTTRCLLEKELEKIWKRLKQTIVLLTNNLDEAIKMADRVIPLIPVSEGRYTLGPSFTVEFSRPRMQESILSNPAFKTLKKAIKKSLRIPNALR